MTKKKILITGCRGLLGSELLNCFSNDFIVKGIDLPDLDICDFEAVKNIIESFQPSVVCHTAAYTDVDQAENEKEIVEAVNIIGTENIAKACLRVNAKLIYYSTNYVFNGEKKAPYTENDIPYPLNIYGYSKLEGERLVSSILDNYLIIRTSWLYGFKGKSFVRSIIKKGYEQIRAVQRGEIITPLSIVNDQIGNPTSTYDLAKQTKVMIENDLKGLYHCSSIGETSWYDLTKNIFDILNMKILMKPCKAKDYPHIAKRPAYSSLENKCLNDAGLNIMSDWKMALSEFLTKQKDNLQNEI
ncbi:MAG: dTDP-4-dehydrorhamnose reductase [bacterium]